MENSHVANQNYNSHNGQRNTAAIARNIILKMQEMKQAQTNFERIMNRDQQATQDNLVNVKQRLAGVKYKTGKLKEKQSTTGRKAQRNQVTMNRLKNEPGKMATNLELLEQELEALSNARRAVGREDTRPKSIDRREHTEDNIV